MTRLILLRPFLHLSLSERKSLNLVGTRDGSCEWAWNSLISPYKIKFILFFLQLFLLSRFGRGQRRKVSQKVNPECVSGYSGGTPHTWQGSLQVRAVCRGWPSWRETSPSKPQGGSCERFRHRYLENLKHFFIVFFIFSRIVFPRLMSFYDKRNAKLDSVTWTFSFYRFL